ncbi:nucleotidyltransferase domain-containing protein [Microbacterium sp. NPDC089695]|uniref:nucleotidyltransferase domain-containing protein n=1 Tax=Microbacterium sp. NPDC089695 TaxID=3364198 RepID=UPI00380BE21A
MFDDLRLSDDGRSVLDAAMERSRRAIRSARSSLAGDPELPEGHDVVAFGSLARFELTPQSDLDWLIVAAGAKHAFDTAPIIERLKSRLVEGVTLSNPGDSKLFGEIISVDDLVTHIGLQEDTNHTTTRRILFLEESVSLAHPRIHEDAMRRVLHAYLHAKKESDQIPRFLLNDIIRYWRTIAVDYQAKAVQKNPKALRYLKLLIPRKLCYVASVAPLYELHRRRGERDNDVKIDYLVDQYSTPALERLLDLLAGLARAGDPDVGERCARVAQTASTFIERSGDADWRAAIEADFLTEDPRMSDHFGTMRTLGKNLHEDLCGIFHAEPFASFSREYMVI